MQSSSVSGLRAHPEVTWNYSEVESNGLRDHWSSFHPIDTYLSSSSRFFVKSEVFMAATMKNAVFWDVMPCGCCKN
jgi:hypothetical protein